MSGVSVGVLLVFYFGVQFTEAFIQQMQPAEGNL
jgi:hypothetical protein